ncbi:MAG TPA: ABC transporter permease [Vicinamibacterales bacterium]|nr:ABC transporter permease [Vicinamibacterales bacterium]
MKAADRRDGATRPARGVLRVCAWLVPPDRRAEWRRQWDADLACQAAFLEAAGRDPRAVRRDLFTRSLGAARHALWFRIRQWRTLMIFQDLKHASRSLMQRPGFTAAIVLTLGLAIGANATIFSWMDALVLNPLPGVPRASELVAVRFATPARSNLSFSYPNYRDVRDSRPHGLTGLAVHEMMPVSLRVDGAPERAWAQLSSGNLFEVLQVPAALGRPLQPSDESAIGQSFVAVISDRLWRTRFAADPDILDRTVGLNGHGFTIVGVAPPAFRGAVNGLAMDLWVPVTMHGVLSGRSLLEARGSGWLSGIGRRTPGTADSEVTASLRVIAARLAADHKIGDDRTLRAVPLSEDGAAAVLLPVVSVVMAVVGLVLLIACANVSGLLLARGVSRRHEIAIRTALGASRFRLARQLFLESLLLAALGGAAGLTIAVWTSGGLDALLPPLPFPVLIGATLNARVLLFSAGIVVLTTIVFGLAPALHGSRPPAQQALRSARASTGGPGRTRMRGLLVVSQVALAMVLLIAAGLFVRTLDNAYDVDPGFTRRDAVLASFDLSSAGYSPERGRAFFDEVVARMEALPGVESASLSTMVPLTIGGGSDTSPIIEGYTRAPEEDVTVYYGMVGPGYFSTMGIPIVAGRPIDARDRDGRGPVVVINETMARRYWQGRDPVGGRLRAGADWLTVAGVAADGKYGSLSEPALSVMYFPIQQFYRANPVLHVATRGPAGPVIGAVRQAVAGLSPDLALFDVRTLDEHLQMSVAIPRMAALLLGIFGGVALLLAAVGLYGLIAFVVGQRTREIGVRMALGADRADILRQVLGQGARLAAAGLVAGAGLAALATPLMASLLVDVSPTDVTTFVATGALLLGVALAAAWLPAARAARVDPVDALRAD